MPMPSGLRPMLCKPAAALPPNLRDYGFEIKWDGIRALLYYDSDTLKLISRNMLELTPQYPELQMLATELGKKRLILDGEIVALNDAGVPSFEQLQGRMGLTDSGVINKRRGTIPITFMIFDLLYVDGEDLMTRPYIERREKLEALKLSGPCWHTPPFYLGQGEALLAITREKQFEGIVGKRLESCYEAGARSGAWIKIKNTLRQEFVIGGWLPGTGTRSARIGSLLIGYYDDQKRFHYAGKVGTGFSEATLDTLLALLKPAVQTTNPFAVRHPNHRHSIFVEPRHVAEIEFTEWTREGLLRHPSFKGLRPDKPSAEVRREFQK